MAHAGFDSRKKSRDKNIQKRKCEGKCIHCSEPASKGKVRCEYHLDYARNSQRKLRMKKIVSKEHWGQFRNKKTGEIVWEKLGEQYLDGSSRHSVFNAKIWENIKWEWRKK